MYNRPPLAVRHVETGHEMTCPAGAPHARNGDQCTIRRVSVLGGQLSLDGHLWDDGRSGELSLPLTRGGQSWCILHHVKGNYILDYATNP